MISWVRLPDRNALSCVTIPSRLSRDRGRAGAIAGYLCEHFGAGYAPKGIRRAKETGSTKRAWLVALMARRSTKVAAISLANIRATVDGSVTPYPKLSLRRGIGLTGLNSQPLR